MEDDGSTMAEASDRVASDGSSSVELNALDTRDSLCGSAASWSSAFAEAGISDSAEQSPCPSAASSDNTSEPQPFPLPNWLLEHCVTLREAWKDTPDFLDLLGEAAFDQETGLLTEAEVCRIQAQDLASMCHVMDVTWFDPLLMLARPEEQRSVRNPRHFSKDVVLLRSPVSSQLPTYRTFFLAAVAKQFAKTIDADLMLLDSEDIKDFTEECWDVTDRVEEDLCAGKLFEPCFRPPNEAVKTPAEDEDLDSSVITWTEPLAALLSAPEAKRRNQSVPFDDERMPSLVIFLSVDQSTVNDHLGSRLRKLLKASLVHKHTIILFARDRYTRQDTLHYDKLMRIHGVELVQLLPVRTPQMRELLMADQRAEQRHKTVRYLQRRIRHRTPGANKPSLVMPHTKWGFLGASLAAKLTRDHVSQMSSLASEILRCLGEVTDDDQIKRAVLGVGRPPEGTRGLGVCCRRFWRRWFC
ncbi:hypothetical protein B0T11DRAFT_98535 [Plectosphaerella cucumerina]|uniref:Uncharacterized protein n=1 Tax=Plectosphaerella cucumerina TaxID=40658 RepID=A0A8K0TGE8_9PEZI|nr:hypothetical protein B0T11DRAFT_98535 [Plectosphaerella cucumerina]